MLAPRTAPSVSSLLVLLVALSTLFSSPVSALTLNQSEFSPGVTEATATELLARTRAAGPPLVIPYNATFNSTSFDVEGLPIDSSATFGDDAPAEFALGPNRTGFDLTGSGIAVSASNSSALYSFTGGGPFLLDGLVRGRGGIMLSPGRTTGTVTLLPVDYGRAAVVAFSAGGHVPAGTSVTFEAVDSGNLTILALAGILPGRGVDLRAQAADAAGFRVRLSAPFAGLTPVVFNASFGALLKDTAVNDSLARTGPANTFADGSRLRAPPNPTAFTRLSANAVIGVGPPGSWWAAGKEAGSLLKTGSQFWLYFGSAGGVGRAVSDDFLTWTVDTNPMLTPVGGNEAGVQLPHVVFDPNKGRYNMYYTCSGAAGYGECLAWSTDGVGNWTRYAGNPIVRPVASTWTASRVVRGAVVIRGTDYKMYAEGTPDGVATDIGLWTSSDGENWSADGGNPIFTDGGGGVDYDINGGDAFWNGTHYLLYYSCAESSYSWGVCLATSVDGVTGWLRLGRTIAYDGVGFDSQAAYFPGMAFADNRIWMVYTGLPTRDLGAAVSDYLPGTQTFTGRFDFGAALPRALEAFSAANGTEGGGTTSFALRSSSDGSSWTAYETVAPGSTPASTPVRRHIEWRVTVARGSATASPYVESVSLGYRVSVRSSLFTARSFSWEGEGVNATALAQTSGAVQSAAWTFSTNVRANWTALPLGSPFALQGSETSLRYRLELAPATDVAFGVDSVTFNLGVRILPRNVTVLIGPPASPVAIFLLGTLAGLRTVSVPPEEMNGTAAVDRGLVPFGSDLTIPIGFLADSPARVRFSNLSAELFLPDNAPPRLFPFPAPGALRALVNETVTFAMGSDDPEGDPVVVTWRVGGVDEGQGEAFEGAWARPGNYTVTAIVRSGAFSARFEWTVEVPDQAPFLFPFPAPGALDAAVGEVGRFAVEGTDPEGEGITVHWSLNGTPLRVSHALEFRYDAPGNYTFEARASAGAFAMSFVWNVSVRDRPPVVLAMPAPGLLNRTTGSTVDLAVAVGDPDGQPTIFAWFVNGTQAGSSPQLSLLLDAPGNWSVRVEFQSGNFSGAVEWRVAVELPPAPEGRTQVVQPAGGNELLYLLLGVLIGGAAGLGLYFMASRREEDERPR